MEALLQDRYTSSTLVDILSDKDKAVLSQLSHSTRDSLLYIDWRASYTSIIGVRSLYYLNSYESLHNSPQETWRCMCVRASLHTVPIENYARYSIEVAACIHERSVYSTTAGTTISAERLHNVLLWCSKDPITPLCLLTRIAEIHKPTRSEVSSILRRCANTASMQTLRYLYRLNLSLGKNDPCLAQVGQDDVLNAIGIMKDRFANKGIVWITGSMSCLR